MKEKKQLLRLGSPIESLSAAPSKTAFMSANLWLSAESRHRSATSTEQRRRASVDGSPVSSFCGCLDAGQGSCAGTESARGPRLQPIKGHKGASSPRCGMGTLCRQHRHGLPGSHLRRYQLCICNGAGRPHGLGLTLRRRTLHLQQAPPAPSKARMSRRPFSLRGPRRPPLAMDVLRVDTCLLIESLMRSLRLGWRESCCSFATELG